MSTSARPPIAAGGGRVTRADRRRQQERRRHVRFAAGAFVVVVGGTSAALALSGGGSEPLTARGLRSKPPVTATAPLDPAVTIATTKKLYLKVSTEPSATAPPLVELGKDLSNGCVRMPNDIILQMAKVTPLLGTPVTITA